MFHGSTELKFKIIWMIFHEAKADFDIVNGFLKNYGGNYYDSRNSTNFT
jgi:hypothetical protein